jgi:hypothetical protein
MRHEVTYIFEYNGNTHKLEGFVDPFENRRHYNPDDESIGSPMDHRGTGLGHKTIHPEVVDIIHYPDKGNKKDIVNILYYLEDVGVYMRLYHDIEEVAEWNDDNPDEWITYTKVNFYRQFLQKLN